MSLRHLRRVQVRQTLESHVPAFAQHEGGEDHEDGSETSNSYDVGTLGDRALSSFAQAVALHDDTDESDSDVTSTDRSPQMNCFDVKTNGDACICEKRDVVRRRRKRVKKRKPRISKSSDNEVTLFEGQSPPSTTSKLTAAADDASSRNHAVVSNAPVEFDRRDCSIINAPSNAFQEEYCLAMDRKAFDFIVELRRIFGDQVIRSLPTESRGYTSVKSRRWWLIQSPAFVTVAHGWFHMVIEDDSYSGVAEFALEYSAAYQQAEESFHAAIATHDITTLQQFIRTHPLHIDALFHFFEALSSANQHEQAFDTLKLAVWSIQCAFHPKFSPFMYTVEGLPQVAMDSRNPFNAAVFKCFGLYMRALASQGCYRTALELCKLLIAMDLSNDAFHALLHVDYYCLRSRAYKCLFAISDKFISQHLQHVVAVESECDTRAAESRGNATCRTARLHEILPNFAFSAALAFFFQREDDSLKDILHLRAHDIMAVGGSCLLSLSQLRNRRTPHLLLMRAILFFPSFIRVLLTKLKMQGNRSQINSEYVLKTWNELVFSDPLWHGYLPTQKKIGSLVGILVDSYVENTHEVWQADIVMRWLHTCAGHLHFLFQEASEAAALREHVGNWTRSEILLDVEKYSDTTVTEFSHPGSLPRAFSSEVSGRNHHTRRAFHRNLISVESSPLIVFLQTLLPWNELDTSGLRAKPIYVSQLLRYCGQGLFRDVLKILHLLRRFSETLKLRCKLMWRSVTPF